MSKRHLSGIRYDNFSSVSCLFSNNLSNTVSKVIFFARRVQNFQYQFPHRVFNEDDDWTTLPDSMDLKHGFLDASRALLITSVFCSNTSRQVSTGSDVRVLFLKNVAQNILEMFPYRQAFEWLVPDVIVLHICQEFGTPWLRLLSIQMPVRSSDSPDTGSTHSPLQTRPVLIIACSVDDGDVQLPALKNCSIICGAHNLHLPHLGDGPSTSAKHQFTRLQPHSIWDPSRPTQYFEPACNNSQCGQQE